MDESQAIALKLDKPQIIAILVGLTLALTVVNTYTTFSMNQQLSAFQGQVVLQDAGAGGSDAIRDSAPSDSGSVREVAAPDAAPPTRTAPAPSPSIAASADDDAVMGSEDAPVTIIEFSDYECPFCSRFYTQTMPSLKKNYIDTGKAKIVFRDFPLGFHSFAQKAAEATECAAEQGKFWEMHDKLFENQSSLDIASLKRFAAELGLNTQEFDSCLDSGTMASEVQKDLSDGQSYGVSGTPTFFINGTKIVGAQPFGEFERIIEGELAGGN